MDIEYILDMLKDKYRDFKKSELLGPFMKKAGTTLQKIMEEMGLGRQFYSLAARHEDINIENTLRYLIRAKMLLRARGKLIEIFALIQKREVRIITYSKYTVSSKGSQEGKGSISGIVRTGQALIS